MRIFSIVDLLHLLSDFTICHVRKIFSLFIVYRTSQNHQILRPSTITSTVITTTNINANCSLCLLDACHQRKSKSTSLTGLKCILAPLQSLNSSRAQQIRHDYTFIESLYSIFPKMRSSQFRNHAHP